MLIDSQSAMLPLDQIITSEFFIGVVVPVCVTGLAVYVKWHVEGGTLQRKHAMIGSDLVLCFIAIFLIHFFRVYKETLGGHMEKWSISHVMLLNAVILVATGPFLLSCMGMERASASGDVEVSWGRLGRNIGLGAVPLMAVAYFLAI